MEVHYGYEKLKFNRPVVTMGVFDGVHRGHRMLLNRVVQEAVRRGSDSVVVTFDPHPRIVLSGDPSLLSFLTDLDERIELLRDTGIGNLVIIPFTKELSHMTAREFLNEILCMKLGVNHLVTGFNHHFGKKHEGTSDTILECSRDMDFTVSREEPLVVEGIAVSSSVIRQMLTEGSVDKAADLLGYNYFLSGVVISGRRIGRNLGFPTANIEPVFRYKLIPRDGVYAAIITMEGNPEKHIAMVNIGSRPTFHDKEGKRSIEAHLIDFEGDLYGTRLCVRFLSRLRDEMKFQNTDMLAEQLRKDRERTINLYR